MRIEKLKVYCAVLSALAAVAGPVSAHGNDDHDDAHEDALVYNCERPPRTAVGRLPDGADQWSRLDCTPLGQRLIAAEGWRWRFPASWTDRPTIPAWAPDASATLPGPKHFTQFQFVRIPDTELGPAHAKLQRDSFSYKFNFDAPPAAMYRLDVHNSEGHEMAIYYPVESADKVWAIPCVPACRPEYAFMIERVKP